MSNALEFFKKSEAFFQFYQEGKYADALAVAETVAAEYPEKDACTTFWLICLQNTTGQSEKALQSFTNAVDRGVSWAGFMLRNDSDLDSLQGNEEIERLVSRSEQMRRQAAVTAEPKLFVHQPEGTGPFPLLIFLHPRVVYPELDFRDWSPALKLGWMPAPPQSSQMASPLSHMWDELEKALNEIVGHVETLREKYPVDMDRIVVASLSQGAARAIELVMSQRIKARGFLAVVPGTLDPTELEQWAGSSIGRGMLISGGKDPRYEMILQIKETLEKHNVPLMFENFPEMAHQIPNEVEPIMQEDLSLF